MRNYIDSDIIQFERDVIIPTLYPESAGVSFIREKEEGNPNGDIISIPDETGIDGTSAFIHETLLTTFQDTDEVDVYKRMELAVEACRSMFGGMQDIDEITIREAFRERIQELRQRNTGEVLREGNGRLLH